MDFDSTTLLNAFTLNYLNVYIVDIKNNEGKIVKLDGYKTIGMPDSNSSFNYTLMLEKYANSRVYYEDKEMFLTQLSIDNIYEKLDKEMQYEFSYKTFYNDSIHYYMAHYIRISRTKDSIIAVCGFRNIDSLINKENIKLKEGLYKGYIAISNIYHTLYRIDVLNNTFSIVKTSDSIRKVTPANVKEFDIYVDSITKYLIDDCYKEEVKKFTDVKTMAERLEGKEYIDMEFRTKSRGWCRGLIVREENLSNGNPRYVIWATELIEDERQREENLQRIAQYDQLTGILNRGFGEKNVTECLEKYKSGMFVIVDCDHFKSINDTYGHLVGDKVIKAIANVLKDSAKKDDIVFRLGGDEFAIYSPAINTKEEAIILQNDIINNLNNINVEEINDTKLYLSFGATFYKNDDTKNFSNLYKRADSAMYKSKKVEGFQINFE